MNYKKTLFWVLLAALVAGGTSCSMQKRLDKQIGQMIVTGFHGDGMGENTEGFAAIENQVKNGHVGGVILFDVDISGLVAQGMTIPEAKKHIFSSNIKNLEQVKAMNQHLQDIAPGLLLIVIDQEGGKIQRLKQEHGFAPIPSAKEMGKGDPKKTYAIAYDLATRLMELGINADMAPVLDVDNPNSPAIGGLDRAFSDSTAVIIAHGGAFARGLNDVGVISSFKHAPGHGNALGDSHNGYTDVTNTWKEEELEPYKELVKNASPCATVMVAHVVNGKIDTLPASLSAKTIQMIRDMGFNGVIISDDMDMGAIVNEYGTEQAIEMAINAGNDILIFGNNLSYDKDKGEKVHQIIKKLVREGKIKKSRIKESYNRIMEMKKCLGKQSQNNKR
ncbi:MAG: glycoside hydrolase family 3 protein [Alphaproteobacteria bacterium]|nr:glycoside hydrolase family 3 protein [Alphaproteobacteria bacterium]